VTLGFCTSLCDVFPGEVLESEQTGDGLIGNESFHGVMLQKVRLIPRAIGERWSDWLINSDVDVQFLRLVRALAERCLAEADICFQRDLLTGELCVGFFAARGCDSVRRLWQDEMSTEGHPILLSDSV